MLGEYTLNLYVNVRGENTWHGPGFEYFGSQLLGRTYDWISRPFFSPVRISTFDGSDIQRANQLRLLGYPIIDKVLYSPAVDRQNFSIKSRVSQGTPVTLKCLHRFRSHHFERFH